MRSRLLAVAVVLTASSHGFAASVFTTRPDDPAAVSVTAEEFGVRADGTADDTASLQAAVDKAVAATNGNGGVVFLPAGRYRLTRTLYVWRGVRIVGYGTTR